MRFLDRLGQNPKKTHQADNRLAGKFENVRSIQDCLELIEEDAAFTRGSPPEDLVAAVYSECEAMRRRGMGLEPNLVGRALPLLIADRIDAGRVTTRFAAHDTDTLAIFAAIGELSRERELPEIERSFFRILQFYPRYPAVWVQYAHSVKDQGRLPFALEYYLEAFALGASLSDIEEHALFVADRIGMRDLVSKKLCDPRTVCSPNDVKALAALFLDAEQTNKFVLELVLENNNLSSIMVELMTKDGFSRANGNLLRYLAETNWSFGDA